jgi:transmembrane sensor
MKENTSHKIEWEIISKYLSGEMNAEEKLTFEKLIDSNPEYAEIVSASDKDLSLIQEVNEIQQQFNVDAAWSAVRSNLSDPKKENTSKVVPLFSLQNTRKLIQIAAMLVITIGLGFASYRIYNNNVPYQSISSELNESGKSITLADGSIVTLNGKSELIYERSFTKNERRVKLTGEAFFTITKNPAKPFIISVGNAEVKVLGTSFNVNASKKHVEVLVETGKVQFSLAKEPTKKIILEKGDFGVLQDDSFEKTIQRDENYLSWKTQLMVFKAMSLQDVAKVINRTYQVNIEFNDTAIQYLPITTSFNKTPLPDVLENLCRPHNLTYEKNGNQIILKKELK